MDSGKSIDVGLYCRHFLLFFFFFLKLKKTKKVKKVKMDVDTNLLTDGEVKKFNRFLKTALKEDYGDIEKRIQEFHDNLFRERFLSLCSVKLFPHQLKSIQEIAKMERRGDFSFQKINEFTNIGIFSDPAGYGKTLSMCAFIRNDYQRCPNWAEKEPYHKIYTWDYKTCYIPNFRESICEKSNLTVINCSTNIIHQWASELSRCGLSCHIIKSTRDIVNFLETPKENIVIVSMNFFGDFFNACGSVVFRRVIFDEIDTCSFKKITKVFSLQSRFFWFISATLEARNLPRVFYSLIPGNFQDYVVKNSMEYINQSITISSPNYNKVKYSVEDGLTSLIQVSEDEKLNHFLTSGNISAALQHTGIDKLEDIFKFILAKHDREIQKLVAGSLEHIDNETVYETFLERIHVAKEKRKNVEERLNSNYKIGCGICYSTPEESTDIISMDCCFQLFCRDCVYPFIEEKKKCPSCMKKLDITKIFYTSLKITTIEEIPCKNQVETAIDIIEQIYAKPSRKVIFFSDYECSEVLSYVMKKKRVKILKGHESTRKKIIDEFRDGEIDFLHLNSVKNCSGINLESATDIVFYHTMAESEVRDQIVGRMCRIGSVGNDKQIYEMVS